MDHKIIIRIKKQKKEKKLATWLMGQARENPLKIIAVKTLRRSNSFTIKKETKNVNSVITEVAYITSSAIVRKCHISVTGEKLSRRVVLHRVVGCIFVRNCNIFWVFDDRFRPSFGPNPIGIFDECLAKFHGGE